MQFGSMLVYCTVYDMCVWGGAHINIFSGGPQSSSYGPAGNSSFHELLLRYQSVVFGFKLQSFNQQDLHDVRYIQCTL